MLMKLEIETVTTFSFYKTDRAEPVSFLLIVVKWGFCYRDKEGQRILIQETSRKKTYYYKGDWHL